MSKNMLITGCSGIGGGIAKQALAKGTKVFVVDRAPDALKALPDDKNLVKIQADVGTEAGVKAIVAAVGDAPLHQMFLTTAQPANQDGKGHPCAIVTRANFDDMMQSTVHGRLFVIQALQENLKKGKDGDKKARVFSIGVPMGDGPVDGKPNGKFMTIPGWVGNGMCFAAARYLNEGLKMEMGADVAFGWGHPGLTKTSLTEEVANKYDKEMMMAKMVSGRFANEDYMTPDESASLFMAMMERSSDEDFSANCWGVNVMCSAFPDVKVKETSDVKGGIKIPAK